MRAAVMQAFGQPLALEDVPAPQPAPGEVLIRVEACGVCHSDLHIVEGDQPRFRAGTKPRLVPGHEVVGKVEAVGPGVTEHRVGDRVGVAWRAGSCGECDMCRSGHENLCAQGGVTGMTVDGGYAQFMTARADYAIPVPLNLTPEEAAPLFCAGVTSYRALKNSGLAPGARVAVIGVGGLGHLAVQIARAMGAEIVALDTADDKLEFARQLGAAHAFRADQPDSIKALRKMGGVHVAIVTSAARQAFDTALQILRPTGTMSVVGLPAEPLQIPALAIVGGELRVMGSAVGTRQDVREILALASAGKVRCRTHSRPLEDVNEVFEEMRQGKIEGRVVLDLAS
jgi:propanol-preferring alcohol dehydrogenase